MTDLEKLLAEVTPGEWSVVIDDDGNPLSGRPSVQASDDLDCGIVHWDGFVQPYWRSARGDKEIHANARLIAMAPELARKVIAAERLVEAIKHQRGMVCQDIGLQMDAENAVEDALAAWEAAQ